MTQSSNPKNRKRLLPNIKKRVIASHINVAGIDYEHWLKSVDEREVDLVAADTQAFEGGVRSLLLELRSSHTASYHELPTRFPPQHTINATLISAKGNDGCSGWMFLDVFTDGPAYNAGIKPGDFLQKVDGVEQAPSDLPVFSIGRMHRLTVCQGGRTPRDIELLVPHAKGTKQRPPIVEPRSVVHGMIQPGVGLLKVAYFCGSLGVRFTSVLDQAVSDLKAQGCDRLIIDLRGNIGGSLGFARLACYLCPDRLPIVHSLTPSQLRIGYAVDQLPRVPMPRNRIELGMALTRFALQDKSLMLLTQGLGPQPFHGKTVLLVNEWTNSAAEIVAAFGQGTGLATVLGQKTRGNVLGAANFPIGEGYWLRLPVFGWFTSQGQSLEGIGVTPDVEVPMPPQLLRNGQDPQLDHARAILAEL